MRSLLLAAVLAASLPAAAQQSHLPPRTAEQQAKDQALADFARDLGITLDTHSEPSPEPPRPSPAPLASAAPKASGGDLSAHDKECLALFKTYSAEEDGILGRINGANQDSIAAGASTYCGATQAGYRELVRQNCPAPLVDGAKKQWDMGLEMLAKHNARNGSTYRCLR